MFNYDQTQILQSHSSWGSRTDMIPQMNNISYTVDTLVCVKRTGEKE